MDKKEVRMLIVTEEAKLYGEVFRLWRQNRGLGINAFGKKYGIGNSVIEHVEDGKPTSNYNWLELLVVYGHTIEELYLAKERLKMAEKLHLNIKQCRFEDVIEIITSSDDKIIEKIILKSKKSSHN